MKILKKISLMVLIILLSFVNYVWANTVMPKNDEALIEAFKATKANPLQANINFNGKISDKFIEIESLKDISVNIIKDLEIVGRINEEKNLHEITDDNPYETYDMEITEGLDMVQITMWGKDKEGRIITAILVTERDPFADFQQTTLFIDIIQNRNIISIKSIKEKVRKMFHKFNCETEISTCIIGTFKGQLNREEKIVKISQAIGSIQGNKVEGLFESTTVSVSIYTPNIDRYIYTGNNKMNLNISMRYNEYEDKTYIWMGTPIITIGY